MARDSSPHIVGPFWLDKRPDGKSPCWQIAWYDEQARTVRYRSTRQRDVAGAKDRLDAHYAADKAKMVQSSDALAVPQILLYWKAHGRKAINADSIACSLRQFIAFLFQDEAGAAVTYEEMRPDLFTRFKDWRMAPHSYVVNWYGAEFRHQSKGVVGATVQRDLNNIHAALNHAVKAGRVPFAPKIAGMGPEHKSEPRKRILTPAEIGSMIGYAIDDPILLRFLISILATAARPVVVRKWKIAAQADLARGLFDVHPPGAPRTKKHNPTVPIPTFWCEWLKVWLRDDKGVPLSIRTRWRTMIRVLGFGPDVFAKTLRHTLATYMRGKRVALLDIEGQLGHLNKSQSVIYAHYDPQYLADAKAAIDSHWLEVMVEAQKWLADHLRTKTGNNRTIVLPKPPAAGIVIPREKDGGR